MSFLEEYRLLVEQKIAFHKENRPEWNNSAMYFEGLSNEIEEIKVELKKDNHVYLEDELGDILWDYMNMLHHLEQEWLISSVEHVFERSIKKYTERVDGQISRRSRKEIKAEQKLALQEEHMQSYKTS